MDVCTVYTTNGDVRPSVRYTYKDNSVSLPRFARVPSHFMYVLNYHHYQPLYYNSYVSVS